MGLSLSTDFILGLLVGGLLTLVLQQVFRATSGLGRWLPWLFFLLFVGAVILLFLWLRG